MMNSILDRVDEIEASLEKQDKTKATRRRMSADSEEILRSLEEDLMAGLEEDADFGDLIDRYSGGEPDRTASEESVYEPKPFEPESSGSKPRGQRSPARESCDEKPYEPESFVTKTAAEPDDGLEFIDFGREPSASAKKQEPEKRPNTAKADRKKNRKTGRKADRKTDKKSDKKPDRERDKEANRETDKELNNEATREAKKVKKLEHAPGTSPEKTAAVPQPKQQTTADRYAMNLQQSFASFKQGLLDDLEDFRNETGPDAKSLRTENLWEDIEDLQADSFFAEGDSNRGTVDSEGKTDNSGRKAVRSEQETAASNRKTAAADRKTVDPDRKAAAADRKNAVARREPAEKAAKPAKANTGRESANRTRPADDRADTVYLKPVNFDDLVFAGAELFDGAVRAGASGKQQMPFDDALFDEAEYEEEYVSGRDPASRGRARDAAAGGHKKLRTVLLLIIVVVAILLALFWLNAFGLI